ncbi:MAG: L-threonylcarbamoyladenylate synthase [Candidatus Cyclobacteriaceae bacterium M2_1C_046]
MAEIGKDIAKARMHLKKGDLVAIPTETVYGLAANAFNPDAVAQVFKAKNRPEFDPLIVHISSLKDLHTITENIPEKAITLAKALWPGPLTLLLSKKNIISDLVTAGMERVAVRIPAHPLITELLNNIDFPLVAPSANPFGYISPTNAHHVDDQLGDKIPYILDGGECKVGIESTIVGFENEKTIIYRLGGVSKEKIEQLIGETEVMAQSTSNPKAPGMLKSHYAPRKKIILGDLPTLIKEWEGHKIGVLSFKETFLANAEIKQVKLAPDGKMETAAKALFSSLRQLDQEDVEVILAEEVPDYGLGRAINDRLRRAAAPKETENEI